jgi:serine/threonine protein kinase
LKIFKEFGSQTELDFKNELEMLNTLSEADHPHITAHLASWTQKKRFYMLFPRAETNMGQFLRLRPHPELSNANVGWLLSQLKGLADGVRRIHNLGPAGLGPDVNSPPQKRKRSGFHHDLKPQNILVFSVGGFKGQHSPITQCVLKISDFGTARIHVILSQSGMDKASFSPKHCNLVRGDPVYSAPDSEFGQGTSRPYDIWSLGCVFLETLLWTFGLSNSNLDTFQVDRLRSHNSRSDKFWHQDPHSKKIILKDAVVLRLRQLQEHCRGRGVFEHLVRLTAKMLTITPKDRPRAPEICNELDAMELQAKQDFRTVDFYRHDISTYVEIAAPPTATDGHSRRPSIDERSVYADEKGLLKVHSNEQRRPSSPTDRRESNGRRLDDQDGDINKDPYRLSPISTDIPPVLGHSRSPSIAISDHDAPFVSAVIVNGANDQVPQRPLGSHAVEMGREDLVRPREPSP